ncbi:tRNA-splicing endonuclease subunit Sen54 [Pelobates cultripes]|uniref:tRNA-splicing endonuclease subunit Sen54, partial n=1 Tax=Pelobates cultripes TaxID=61616 RepID=A0AAD1SIS8_PELCU|nr:tRNA-splicing endonuclease subunit Sen54 [Pelobates cultripes]
MGSTEQGKQCLLPEEAVYLLECGTVQIFYKELQLSVQEAYERLLTHQTITMQQYQVYSYLKRLGYIVTRFKASSVMSTYERQINVQPCSRSRQKRKRSSSPKLKENLKQNKEDQQTVFEDIQDLKVEQSLNSSVWINQFTSTGARIADTIEDINPESANQLENTQTEKLRSPFRWDFSKILFPSCAPDHSCNLLPPPEHELLPENVAGRELDISLWRLRLNQKMDKMSRREQEQYDWEQRFKTSINADPMVQKCTSWKEYKKLLQDRGHSSQKERPHHLWAGNITPLVTPQHGMSTASVLEQITVMHQSHLLDDSNRLQNYAPDMPQILFDVHQSDGTSEFKKSRPGKPYARICVCSFDEPIPSLHTVKCLALRSGDVPVVFALVNCGEVAFYTFKDFQLPVDVYP